MAAPSSIELLRSALEEDSRSRVVALLGGDKWSLEVALVVHELTAYTVWKSRHGIGDVTFASNFVLYEANHVIVV